MQRETVRVALHEVLNRSHLAEKLHTALCDVLGENVDCISPYGYLVYLKHKHGEAAAYPNLMGSASNIQAFVDETKHHNETFGQSVVQTVDRMLKMLDIFGVDNIDMVIDRMEGSASDAAIYMACTIMKDAAPVDRLIEKTRKKATYYFRRYPSVIDTLPEQLQTEARYLIEHAR